MITINNCDFFCSWSGGKDSCLALYRSIKDGGNPKILLTLMIENGERSRSHGLPQNVIQAQAESLNINSIVCPTSWDDYEQTFITTINKLKQKNIGHGVFGDIDLQPHLDWVERVCSSVAVKAHEPLWQSGRRDLLEEFLRLGFKATIVAIKQSKLDDSFLGRVLDWQVISDLEAAGVDASGEEGEYHTVVTDGPIFTKAIAIQANGIVAHNGYSFLDVSLQD